MHVVQLEIRPHFVGPASVGTVAAVKVLRRYLGAAMGEAKSLVDRAVFDGDRVEIRVDDADAAEALAGELNALPGPAHFEAVVVR
jgi:ribosomal protein L7/L12